MYFMSALVIEKYHQPIGFTLKLGLFCANQIDLWNSRLDQGLVRPLGAWSSPKYHAVLAGSALNPGRLWL
jgi:hypothetical protein